MYPVYLITNAVNSKQYVGCCPSGQSAEERFKEHYYAARKHSRTYLHNAIRKYSVCQFTVQQIDAGSRLSWTPERREAQAQRMRVRRAAQL